MVSRGWSYFLIGILLSSFLGGAIRVFFSPPRIRAWVEEVAARKQPKFTLEFKEARLAFANGWSPGLAVEFVDLKIRARDLCVTGSEILIDRLNIPVQASAIFSQKKLRFGVISADQLRVNIRPAECESQLEIPKLVESMDKLPRLVRLEKFMKERWSREAQNTVRLLDGLRIEKFMLHENNSEMPLLSVAQLEAQILPESDSVEMEFTLEPGVGLVGHQPVGRLRSHLSLSPEALVLNGRGNLKEGQYQAQLKWDVSSGFWAAKMQMQDMPAANLMALMEGWGIIQWPEFNPRNEWFRCQLKADGSLVSWEESPVRFENCGFYGDLGEIHIHTGESKLFKAELFPITADFRNVKMDPVLMQFGLLRHWLSSDGKTSGELQLKEEGGIQYQGIWRKPQFQIPVVGLFSLGGVSMDQVHMTWDYSQDKTSLHISKPTAYGEDFPLDVKLSEDLKTKVTDIEWDINWRVWPKAMDKLLHSLKAESLQTKGRLSLGEADAQLSLSLKSKAFQYNELQAQELNSKLQYSENKGAFNITAESFQLEESSSLQLISKMLELSGVENKDSASLSIKGEFDQQGRWVVNPLQINKSGFVGRGFKMAVDQGVYNAGQKSFNVFGSLEEPRFEEAQAQ